MLRLLEQFSLAELTGAVEYALDIGVIDPDEHPHDPRASGRAAGRSVLAGRASASGQGAGRTTDLEAYRALRVGGDAMKKTETKSMVLLKHHLKALKLPTIHAECEKVASRCAADNVDHLAFLLQLCELELIERERKAAERRLKAAKFPAHKRWTRSTSGPTQHQQAAGAGTR